MKKYGRVFFMIMFISAVSGCNPYNNAGEGAGVGGALGGLAGGIIGHQSHSTGTGVLIGGALGAATGAVVGSQIQKPESQPAAVAAQGTPAVVTQPAGVVGAQVPMDIVTQDSVTINVLNNHGGYTAVVLKRSGNGFVGPQGEYYSQLPTTDQLKVMYGR